MRRFLLFLLMLMFSLTLKAAPQLTIALTLAIERDSLITYIREGAKAHARLVVRGCNVGKAPFETNFFLLSEAKQKAQKAELLRCFKELSNLARVAGAGLEIAPDVFKTYRIAAAPVFILEDADGNGNTAILRGLVSVDWARRKLRESVSEIKGKNK